MSTEEDAHSGSYGSLKHIAKSNTTKKTLTGTQVAMKIIDKMQQNLGSSNHLMK